MGERPSDPRAPAELPGTTPCPPFECHTPIPNQARRRSTSAFVPSVVCLLFVVTGGIIVWYGCDGIWYACTRAPAVDRNGDLTSAVLLASIGLTVGVSSLYWLWCGVSGKGRR
jgi:hypothetical protein